MVKALKAILLLLPLVLLAAIPAVASANTSSSVGEPRIMPQQAVPSVSISASANVQARLNSPVTVTATFSEPVSGFTLDDINVANGTASSFSGSDGDAVYTFEVTPTALDEVTVDIAAGVATDGEGNPNTEAQQLSLGIPYDFDGSGGIGRTETIAAIRDYFDGNITRGQAIAVIRLYFSAPTEPEPGPSDDCIQNVASDGTLEGQWAGGCESETRSGSHARYYTFTLDASSEVTVRLESSAANTYLYLRRGDATSGTALYENDDHDGTTTSQIAATLAAVAYTIEATTYSAGETGSFALTVSGLGATGPTSTPPGTATSDRAALVALYNGMDGPTWPNSANWLTDAPLDEWFGVTTDGSTGRVIDLTLIDNNLKGQLPPELGDLTALEGLDLGGNFIYDYNLPTLSDLPSLRRLSLFRNFISDVSALSNLTRLEILELYDNGVSDISPLLDLPSLRILNVWANPLTGRSVDEHIPALQARGVEVAYADIAFTGGGFTVEDGPQIYNDNLFILPVEPGDDTWDYAVSYYRYFEDEFDFLMFITTDRLVLDTKAAGWFIHVMNDVQGIGMNAFSDTHEFGSAGRLQGVMFFSALQEFRIVGLHELMHRWGAFILPGEVSSGPHWRTPSDIFGILDGNCDVPFDEIVELGEDRYLLPECSFPRKYSPLELYLAGFIPPEEVPEFWVAQDAQWIEQRRSEQGLWDRVFTASEIKRYTIDDVIAAHGRRVPEAPQAQREFRAAAILLIDENHPASMDVLNVLSGDVAWLSHAGVDGEFKNFYEATGGRAKIIMDGLAEFLKDSATLPGAPEELMAAGNGQTRIDLSWSAPSSNGGAAITGYKIEVSTNGSSWSNPVADTGDTATSYSHTGLTAGSTHYYRVSAINSAGTGPASNVATGTTEQAASPDLVVGSPSVSNSRPRTGASFTMSVTVRNQGEGLSAATTLRYYRSTNAAITPADTQVGTDAVGALSASGTSAESIDLAAPSTSGTYYYGVCVDAVSDETATTNNCSTAVAVTPVTTGDDDQDRAALVALYNATNGPNWNNNRNWLSDRPIGEWSGVFTDATGRVKYLYLRNNGLSGQIPGELGNLTNLTKYLDLSFNDLVGPIPPELGNLADLEELRLNHNELTGSIPTELGNLSSLTILLLNRNDLTGSIPSQLGNLSKLTRLDLGSNELSGAIPIQVGNLTDLTELDVWNNELSGPIPIQLANLASLTNLVLTNNNLSGTIPTQLGNLTNLTVLGLGANNLDGTIPPQLGNLSNLTMLLLGVNNLTGEIPAQMTNLTNLLWLTLSNNHLTGCVPGDLRSIEHNDLDQLELPDCA